MTLLKIAQIGHPVLRQRARELSQEELKSPETQSFIDNLIETMRDANGAGLAAIQVYQPVRIVVIEVHDNPRYPYKPNIPLTILVNPVLRPRSNEMFDNFEGCLSVPNLRGIVQRHVELEVSGWDRHGNHYTQEWRGISAGTFQHEVDHLDGKLFLDRVTDTASLCTITEFERYHRDAFIAQIRPLLERFRDHNLPSD